MSSQSSPRLGKGLEALIPKSVLVSGKSIINIPTAEIIPNQYQPRLYFDPDAIQGLANSIKQHGLAQPIVVRRNEEGYELIAGERRYRACQLAGMTSVPSIIKDLSDKESLQLALIENLDREDLNAIEEAKGYLRLIDEFGVSHLEIGEIFGKSRSAITNTLRLLQLPSFVQEAVVKGDISEGHARVLLQIENIDDMLVCLESIKSSGLSVRDVEAFVKSKEPVAEMVAQERAKGVSKFFDIESKIGDRLGVPVLIRGSKKKGKVLINYQSTGQLEALLSFLEKMEPLAYKTAGLNL